MNNVSCTFPREEIFSAVIMPSFLEELTLPKLLSSLLKQLQNSCAVVVCDDSPLESQDKLVCNLKKLQVEFKNPIIVLKSNSKRGRGDAVRRGIEFAVGEFPNLREVLECDSDGSHQINDILKILNSDSNADLIIGSRYLPGSLIIGWPTRRRIFSRMLNVTIPRLLRIAVSDITNGLRRYSIEACFLIMHEPNRTRGFIYLAEQAQIIARNNLRIEEFPTTFVNREIGKSSVGIKELYSSLVGLIELYSLSIRKKKI